MINRLTNIKQVITHTDNDGVISLYVFLNLIKKDIDFQFVDYDTVAHKNIKYTENMLFVDMVPHINNLQEAIDNNVLVIDHHKTQEDIIKKLNGIYTPGTCGAKALFDLINPDDNEDIKALREIVELVNIRDVWIRNHNDWDKSEELSIALENQDKYFVLEVPPQKLLFLLKQMGNYYKKAISEKAKKELKQANQININNKNILVIKNPASTPTNLSLYSNVDILICLFENINDNKIKTTIAFRSRCDYDVSIIAKHFGGGGHFGAAGCNLDGFADEALNKIIIELTR